MLSHGAFNSAALKIPHLSRKIASTVYTVEFGVPWLRIAALVDRSPLLMDHSPTVSRTCTLFAVNECGKLLRLSSTAAAIRWRWVQNSHINLIYKWRCDEDIMERKWRG